MQSGIAGAIRLALQYLGLVAIGNLLWETAHLPLYTVWFSGSLRDRAVAVMHCWIGDVLIAIACLIAALLLAGRRWPASGRKQVAFFAVLFGVAYTVYSEWINVQVRHAWTYSSLMPVIPPLRTGLSPLLQWLAIPPLAFVGARRMGLRGRSSTAVSVLATMMLHTGSP